MNLVIITGALGADPDIRQTQGGTSVCKLRVATSERYKDKNGEWKSKTEWHNVVVWGARGQYLGEHLSKGSKVAVRGSLTTSSYEKNGEKRYSTEIKADDVEIMERQERREAAESHAEPEGLPPDDPLPF